MLLAVTLLVGCDEMVGDYVAASSIARNGFARDEEAAAGARNQEIKLWGFVDHGNLYGDASAKRILREWWAGEGPDAETWRFNIKAEANDPVGHSFAVDVPNDPGRNELLRVFLADARARKPTKVYVTGRISSFDAPTNTSLLTGFRMELSSSADLRFKQPEKL